MKNTLRWLAVTAFLSLSFGVSHAKEVDMVAIVKKIQMNKHNPEQLKTLLPIVHSSFTPSRYEQILMTQLRDQKTGTTAFRKVSRKIGELLVNKVVETLPIAKVEGVSPVERFEGKTLAGNVELVSIVRSGDALVDVFIDHFPNASVSKILIQRDEETAKPYFKHMKLSPTIASGGQVVITEPMIATGGSLDTAIRLLKEKGVQENNIVVAAVCAAPEGLVRLGNSFPGIKVVMTALDEKLNDKKYIVPGIGDFGDRNFGTPAH